ncbi:MAG: hypothetical protein ACI3W8_08265 [Oscillospiraceae bacterium]
MRRCFLWLLLAGMVLLAACGGAEPEKAAVTNPVRNVTKETVQRELGVSFQIPEGASEVRYAIIAGGEADIAEMCFTLEGAECACRIMSAGVPGEEVPDISGMYYDWEKTAEASVGYNRAQLSWIEGAQGVIRWYDYAPGLLYSVSVSGGATEAKLTELAAALYVPMQGETDGARAASAHPELTNLLAAISQNYHVDTAGSSLKAAVYAGTLLDWLAENEPGQEALAASVIDFLSALEKPALEAFPEQLRGVHEAARELCGAHGEELLDSCGYEPAHYPWDEARMEESFAVIWELVGE